MITIKLFAGLGNQLFQHVYGQYLKQQGHKVQYILARTPSDLLSVFAFPPELNKEIFAPQGKLAHLQLTFKKIIAKYLRKSYFTDFFQQVKYVQALPKLELTFKNKHLYQNTSIYQQIKQTNAVSIHIRGGDYLVDGGGFYGNICTPSYYSMAMDRIKQTITNPVFFIFTNDTIYTTELLQDFAAPYVIVNDESFSSDPGFDLFLMSECKHNIIANSTFSWWGAWLNQNPDKIVIAPPKWNNSPKDPIHDIVPKEWILQNGFNNNTR